jgi:hypothetical protein
VEVLERATIVALLKRNKDPRQSALAERLGVARELALAEAEEPHLLRFANQRDAMLLAMFALPDDRMTRTVTADWLLGFADPLGELLLDERLLHSAERQPEALPCDGPA